MKFKQVNECARFCQTDPAHISRILSGKAKPGVELASRMARFYQCTIGELLKELGVVDST